MIKKTFTVLTTDGLVVAPLIFEDLLAGLKQSAAYEIRLLWDDLERLSDGNKTVDGMSTIRP
jgi:hypothetical protein